MATQTKDWEPTSEQADSLLGFTRNNEYFIKHIDQMKRQYAGKFIAILNNSVVLDDDDAQRLLDLLRKRFKELERSETYVTYVPTEHEVRIA